jgi:hypothetical protein
MTDENRLGVLRELARHLYEVLNGLSFLDPDTAGPLWLGLVEAERIICQNRDELAAIIQKREEEAEARVVSSI